MTTYAWVITEDHLADSPDYESDAGVAGPSDCSDDALAGARAGKGHLFRMYDDDGILYYTGRLYDTSGEYDDEACYAPLGDFGTPNAGAVLVKYHGHPEMDCG